MEFPGEDVTRKQIFQKRLRENVNKRVSILIDPDDVSFHFSFHKIVLMY